MKLEAGKLLGVSTARAALLALLCTYPLTATTAAEPPGANPQEFVAAASVESTEKAMQNYTSSDAEALVRKTIEEKTKANNGVFPLEDPLNSEQLKLVFDDIDFTRTIDGYGFFPDVKFHDQADASKHYLIDFWVVPANGQLRIQETRIYKEPVKTEGTWTLTARSPVPWWWIPASEHPGHMANKRGWEVMSAVERDALAEQAKNHGVFHLKDDKTGKVLDLQFIDTHQPVRQLDDNGHYFACTVFRAVCTKDQIYYVDFWFSDKDGVLNATLIPGATYLAIGRRPDGRLINLTREFKAEAGKTIDLGLVIVRD